MAFVCETCQKKEGAKFHPKPWIFGEQILELFPRHLTLQTERNLKGKGASTNPAFFWSHLQGVEGAALAQLMWEKVAGMGGEKLRDHL